MGPVRRMDNILPRGGHYGPLAVVRGQRERPGQHAYAKHTAYLLHRVTHNHQPPRNQGGRGRPPRGGTHSPQHLPPLDGGTTRCTYHGGHQYLGPTTTPPPGSHAHHPHKPPLQLTGAPCFLPQGHPATPSGNTLCLVGATITIAYITPRQMETMVQSVAHHAPVLATLSGPHGTSSKRTYGLVYHADTRGDHGHIQHFLLVAPTPLPYKRQNPQWQGHDTRRAQPVGRGMGCDDHRTPAGRRARTCHVYRSMPPRLLDCPTRTPRLLPLE